MDLREYIVERTKAYNREKRRGNTYSPPGAGVRQTGDWIAMIGTLALGLSPFGVFTLLEGIGGRYPALYSTFGPNGTLAVVVLVPLGVAVVVWASILMGGWKSRLGTTVLGLVGVALTWDIARELYAWAASGATAPNITLAGISFGCILIFVGSLIATGAAYFTEWALKLGT